MQRLMTILLTSGVIVVLLACCKHESASQEPIPHISIPVFPGAVGFGTDTPAGRGGEIIHVTNLNSGGEGSLAAAASASGPRIIVFDVGGVIELKHEIKITEPYLTIAGQSAPSPGIMLKGAGLSIKTHDVLVQHLRIRVGDDVDGQAPELRDAVKIIGENTYNIVIDHVSMSWAIDENLSTWSGPSKITISNSVIGEGLSQSLHPDGEHSKGFLVGPGTRELSLVGNLFAHNRSRNPLIYGGTSTVLLNNVFYNNATTSFVSISDGWKTGPSQVALIGNHFLAGPDSSLASAIKIERDCANGTQVFLRDNIFDGQLLKNKTPYDMTMEVPPVWHSSIAAEASPLSLRLLLGSVGARVGGLDSVDARLVKDVLNGTGRIINSPEDVDGWPLMDFVHRRFVVPPNPYDDDDNDGYSNIEEELFRLSEKLLKAQ